MLSNAFIYSEMLAESCVNNVGAIKELLLKGRTEECLSLLTELEHSMQITLAMGELYDLKMVN